MDWNKIKPLIKRALKEDIGKGDITTKAAIPKGLMAEAVIRAKEYGVICGLDAAKLAFNLLDTKIKFRKKVKDGDAVKAGQTIAIVKGNARKILEGERVSLNFLQRLSGIATLTSQYVRKVKPYKARILDTRKTTPGLRLLEKYAVKIGGGKNHRFGLYDAVLIKDSHINLVGFKKAVERTKKYFKKIEIETENLREVKDALDVKADIIMLDNMDIKTMRKAVKLINGRAIIEASGGMNLDSVRSVAKTGVDWISIGGLTHSVKVLDINLTIKK